MRRAHSTRPATYRCPFCGELLHAMSEHVVIAPEGDASRRRHAHTECIEEARRTDENNRQATKSAGAKLARVPGEAPYKKAGV